MSNFNWRDTRFITGVVSLVAIVIVMVVPSLEAEQQYIEDNLVELISALLVGGGISYAFIREYFRQWLATNDRNDDLVIGAISRVTANLEKKIEQVAHVDIPDAFRESLVNEVSTIIRQAQEDARSQNTTVIIDVPDVNSLDINP